MAIQVIKLVIDNAALEDYEKVYFAEHPRAKKKPIAQPYHESINKWMIMKRPQMNALKQKWKDFIVYFIRNSEYSDVHIEQCELRFVTYYGTERRHDIDNGCPKFILDGLCESGFIIDDDSKHITSLTMQCFVDAGNPRTEIEVNVSKLLTDYKRPELKEEKRMAKAKKATKATKVSISALDEIVKNTYAASETVEWNGVEVTIKRSLSMTDMLNFVDSVVESCFDSQTDEYRPEAKDFAVRVNVMTRYANFALPEKNVEHQYELAICSGAVEMILERINGAQFNEMMRAIDSKIQNRASANVHVMTRKFDDVVESFRHLQNDINKAFSGLTPEDMATLTKVAADGVGNPEALVKAFKEHMGEKAQN